MGKERNQTNPSPSTRKINKLNALVDSVCGLYARVARHLGVHRSFVSRVARGERRSQPVEHALLAEYEQAQKH